MNARDARSPRPAGREETGYAARLTRRLIAVMAAVIVVASVAVGVTVLKDFNRLLTPELERKALLIGDTVATDLDRALGYGIPLNAIYGADAYLDAIVEDHDELKYVVVRNAAGSLLYRGGGSRGSRRGRPPTEAGAGNPPAIGALDYSVPFGSGAMTGVVHVGVDRRFVQRQLDDIFFDVIVILVTAILVTLEIMLALVLVYGTEPIRRLSLLLDRQSAGAFAHVLNLRTRDSVGRAANWFSNGARELHERFAAALSRAGLSVEGLRFDTDAGAKGARLRRVGERFALMATGGPKALRLAGVSDVRIPLFLFAFAEELQKSFMPLFVRQVYEPVPWLGESVAVGLPIAVYLVVLGLAAPYAGGWARRYGGRTLFLAGLVPAVAGFLGCAVAESIGQLVFWRGTTALGYAMVTIACQDYVLAVGAPGRQGRDLVMFVGVIMSATVCGTAIGGILADRMGYHAVFALAALVAIVAGGLAAGTLADARTTGERTGLDPASSSARPFGGGMGAMRVVLANLRFVLFLVCVAVPANVLVAAYLWYLVPLYLSDLGASASEIARVVMAYYLLIVVVGPLASRLADNPRRLGGLVGLGTVLSAAGLVLLFDWRSIWAVVITVTILGTTHALTKGAQVPLALQICRWEIERVGRTTVLGILRSLERLGSMFGLLLASVMVEYQGYSNAMGILGLLVSSAGFVFLVAQFTGRKERPAGA